MKDSLVVAAVNAQQKGVWMTTKIKAALKSGCGLHTLIHLTLNVSSLMLHPDHLTVGDLTGVSEVSNTVINSVSSNTSTSLLKALAVIFAGCGSPSIYIYLGVPGEFAADCNVGNVIASCGRIAHGGN